MVLFVQKPYYNQPPKFLWFRVSVRISWGKVLLLCKARALLPLALALVTRAKPAAGAVELREQEQEVAEQEQKVADNAGR